jgi:hypothetical protein
MDIFSVQVIYELRDVVTEEKYEVTRYIVQYTFTTDHNRTTVEDLYSLCEETVDALKSYLSETPGWNLSCSPMENLQENLQKCVGYYNSH